MEIKITHHRANYAGLDQIIISQMIFLGATILPNLNENMSYGNHDGKYPNFYFAIIIGRSDEYPQLQFDMRHSSKPEMTIKKEIQRVSADSFK